MEFLQRSPPQHVLGIGYRMMFCVGNVSNGSLHYVLVASPMTEGFWGWNAPLPNNEAIFTRPFIGVGLVGTIRNNKLSEAKKKIVPNHYL